jgi:hypothetical protein
MQLPCVAAVEPQLSVDFRVLRRARNRADYDMSLTRRKIADQAEQACTTAASIIFRLDQHAMTLETSAQIVQSGPTWFLESDLSLRALSEYLPKSPVKFDEAVLYLLSYPHLIPTIHHAIAIAREEYPGATPVIDTVRYESDEPPLRLMLRQDDPAILDGDRYVRYMARLRDEADYRDSAQLAVFPDHRQAPPNDPRRAVNEAATINYQAQSRSASVRATPSLIPPVPERVARRRD